MCGLAGFVTFNQASEPTILDRMTDSLAHRGPDGRGIRQWVAKGVTVGFGHRRLSIIDPNARSDQPMQRGHLHLIFNGEIYNYQEIKADLRSSKAELLSRNGFKLPFTTQGDTEVVLAAYAAWGPECVERFRGMFSFVIYDEAQQKVLLFRDRLGVKPLFHYQKNGLHLFASELKAFHAHPSFDKTLNKDAVTGYFRYGFVPSPLCIFQHVTKIRPGTYLEIDLATQKTNSNTYWSASQIIQEARTDQLPEAQRLDEIEAVLRRSFDYRMVADVPVGVFLSGGYDSSLVAALLQRQDRPINTFTIAFEDAAYNEAPHALKVADFLGTHHHQFTCTAEEARKIVKELPFHFDEPFADSSAIPTFLLCQRTAKLVKVALSADGGDELFAGYRRNLRFLDIQRQAVRLPASLRKLGSSLLNSVGGSLGTRQLERSVWLQKAANYLKRPDLLSIFDTYPRYFMEAELDQLLICKSAGNNPQEKLLSPLRTVEDTFNALLSADYQSTLVNDMLVKVDRASMANGLEGREPMLDHEIYEYLAKVSSAEKLATSPAQDSHSSQGVQLKYLLKKITHRHLPQDLMERPKQGFGVPINRWLGEELRPLVERTLAAERIRQYGVLNVGYTQLLIRQQLANPRRGPYLWMLLNFQMWCDRWL